MAELRQKLAEVIRAHDVLEHQIKKVSQLEAEVANLKDANRVQLSIHQAEIQLLQQEHATQLEAKDAFCDVEKVHVLSELQAKLSTLYDEQYDLCY